MSTDMSLVAAGTHQPGAAPSAAPATGIKQQIRQMQQKQQPDCTPACGDTVVTILRHEDQCSSDSAEQGHQLSTKDVSPQPAAAADASTQSEGSNKFLKAVAHNFHFFTFAPLIIIGIMQDIDVVMGAAICVAVVCSLMLAGFFLKRGRYIKVYPKKFDLFNLALYSSLIPIGILQHTWLLHWVSVYTNAGNASFMWATILLPCRNFVMDSVTDRVPPKIVNHPLIRRMALMIACVWATALTIMTVASIIPPATRQHPTDLQLMTIFCSYIFGFGPLLVAMILQHIISHVYRKRLHQEMQQHMARQAQEAAAARAATAVEDQV